MWRVTNIFYSIIPLHLTEDFMNDSSSLDRKLSDNGKTIKKGKDIMETVLRWMVTLVMRCYYGLNEVTMWNSLSRN